MSNEPFDYLGAQMEEAERELFGGPKTFEETVSEKPWMLDLALARRQPRETASLVVQALKEGGFINGKRPSRAKRATVGTGIGAGVVGLAYMVVDLLKAVVNSLR